MQTCLSHETRTTPAGAGHRLRAIGMGFREQLLWGPDRMKAICLHTCYVTWADPLGAPPLQGRAGNRSPFQSCREESMRKCLLVLTVSQETRLQDRCQAEDQSHR